MAENNLQAVGAGVVACGHRLEAEAAIEVLRSGGNAIDAAVCMALVGCVVEHRANGLAGYGTIMTIYLADSNQVVCVDANSAAPRLARPDMYELEGGWSGEWPTVRNRENFVGPRSVSVPGTVAGLGIALERFGTKSFAEVAEPAEYWARHGYPIQSVIAKGIVDFEPDLKAYPGARDLLYPHGVGLKQGDTLVQADLADTLHTLATKGYREFYEGEIGRKIAAYVSSIGGLLTFEDMAEYQPFIKEPLRINYRGVEVCTSPLPTGGPTVAEILRVMEQFELPEIGSTGYLHLLAEILVRVWDDRLTLLGDPDFVSVDLDYLLSERHAGELAKEVREAIRASASPVPGPPGGTTHYTAADQWGNVVALTQTHGMGFGSKVLVPGLGVFLGHGMSRFNPVPGNANSIAPRKRPLHNMSPTILLKDGKPWASAGTPGGRAVITAVAQVISHLVDRNMNVYEAIQAPRMHREIGERIQLESSLFKRAGDELMAFGYDIREVAGAAGPVHGVQRLENGEWMSATDHRSDTPVCALSV